MCLRVTCCGASSFVMISPTRMFKVTDELQRAVQFSQDEEEKIRNSTGTMNDVQEALVKQLDQLKYLAPQAAIDNLTGDTADSLAILKQAYSTFDIDGDGIITDTEVKTLLKGLGVNISQESLSDLFSRFDKDGNNALDFNEFVMMMRSMKQASRAFQCLHSPILYSCASHSRNPSEFC